MNAQANPMSDEGAQHAAAAQAHAGVGARHLRWFLGTTLLVWGLVIALNLLSLRMIIDPRNQAPVQMISGWERTYKPIVFDRLAPEIAVFGASWARDAFDPQEMTSGIGKPFFNHAVSGGQPYEGRRFLQSAAAYGSLRTAIINLDSFLLRPERQRFGFGFNESLLAVNADGSPNATVDRSRVVAIAISGASLGYNFSVARAVWRLSHGESKEDVIESYDRYDYSRLRGDLDRTRSRVFPAGGARVAPAIGPPLDLRFALTELARALDVACRAKLEVYAYFTPHHAISPASIDQTARLVQVYDYLAARQTNCGGRLHYFDFNYPNAVTLEAVDRFMPRGYYYRSDGHPRPTVGRLMAMRMLAYPAPPVESGVAADFGIDLLKLSRADAIAWIERTQRRWNGEWRPVEEVRMKAALANAPRADSAAAHD